MENIFITDGSKSNHKTIITIIISNVYLILKFSHHAYLLTQVINHCGNSIRIVL